MNGQYVLLARVYSVDSLEAIDHKRLSRLRQRLLQPPRNTIFAKEPLINIQPASKIPLNPHRCPVVDLLAFILL